VEGFPRAVFFKPQGIPMRELDEVNLTVEGLEAVRLADLEGLTMEDAATRMHVSRHTFGRVLAEARKAIADALVHSLALRIEGGHYELEEQNKKGIGRPQKEQSMTKVAVTSEGPGLQDRVDPRFGRAAGFVIVDLETMATQYVDNGQVQTLSHGAGIQAAELIANSGAKMLLTGSVGPKAFQALNAVGIKIGIDLGNMSVQEAVQMYKEGKVTFADKPNK
jgi:predicted DNA-binding protein (UPF0251 family)/predicted Fe-Mo cluster-binding NifX family protein